MQIYKYTLSIVDNQEIEMPAFAQILCVQIQDGLPQIWVAFESTIYVKRKIIIIETNYHREKWPSHYIGTFQLQGGSLVYHVFDDGEV